MEKRKKEIEAEQRAISVPFVEQLGQGCKAVLEDGTNRYRITYNPTRRTSVGKDQMEKLKNQHPFIWFSHYAASFLIRKVRLSVVFVYSS